MSCIRSTAKLAAITVRIAALKKQVAALKTENTRLSEQVTALSPAGIARQLAQAKTALERPHTPSTANGLATKGM